MMTFLFGLVCGIALSITVAWLYLDHLARIDPWEGK
jgi:hypothetical protein